MPFLVWLDLQQRRIISRKENVTLPHLGELLPAWLASAVAATLILATAALAGSAVKASLIRLAGLLLLVCGTILAVMLSEIVAKRRTFADHLLPTNSCSAE